MDDRSSAGDSDEASAREARARYRVHGLEPLEPTGPVRDLLAPGELLLAAFPRVALEVRRSMDGGPPQCRPEGNLYVSSERLVHGGREPWAVRLDDIDDAAVSGDRILLVLRDGAGIALNTEQPRLLRVRIATARAARIGRAVERVGAAGAPPDALEAQANAR
jgi:hypothetical protein